MKSAPNQLHQQSRDGPGARSQARAQVRAWAGRARRAGIALYVVTSIVGPWLLVASGALPWTMALCLWVALLFLAPGVVLHVGAAMKVSRLQRRSATSL